MMGSGTQANPYVCSNAADLTAIQSNPSAYYILANDIDFGGATINPIIDKYHVWTGSFDGQGYTLKNFSISPNWDTGLFSYISTGIVKNFNILNATLSASGNKQLGIICANFTGNGAIQNCSVEGSTITGSDNTGILVGYISGSGSITDCTVKNCTINSGSAWQIGGAIGQIVNGANPTVTVAVNGITITASGGSNYGGLIGLCEGGTLSDCCAIVTAISNTVNIVGGFVGKLTSGALQRCYSSGQISGVYNPGGFVGHMTAGSITNCFSMASVPSANQGGNFASLVQGGSIAYCYATGVVSGATNAGFINTISGATANNNYWDATASGQSSGYGATGKTTAEMKTQSTYINWDFNAVWKVDPNINNGYPAQQSLFGSSEPEQTEFNDEPGQKNYVDNSKLLISTIGDIEVMDSEGNMPYNPADHCYASNGICSVAGGNGEAPDNYWFLGGPDYGTFEAAGGIWSDVQTPGGGKTIMLDAADPKVRLSGGVTQVVPVFQTEVKPIRVSAYVKGEGLNGHPRINFGFIGSTTDFIGAGGGDLVFYVGTYDFTFKRLTFIPSRPVKYLFLHLLHRGFTEGKAWYGEFTVEELDMPVVEMPENNRVLNPNFFYSGDDINPTAWKITGASMDSNTSSPLGTTSLLVQPGGSVEQKNIVVDAPQSIQRQKVSVYSLCQKKTTFEIKITTMDRYRRKVSEKKEIISAGSAWSGTDIYLTLQGYIEKIDVAVTNTGSNAGHLGAVCLIAEEYENSFKILNESPTETRLLLPEVSADSTKIIDLLPEQAFGSVKTELSDSNNIIYLTNGRLGSFWPSSVRESIKLYKKSALTKVADGEYSIPADSNGLVKIFDGERETERLLRIPHLVHPDRWHVTSGGSIPASDTRYYCVTALNNNGETTASNEVRAITSASSNSNCVPIEITPVIGAKAYRIYMTKTIDEVQPWQYEVNGIKKLVWNDGQDHLVKEVTAAELRDAGYVIYDTGLALGAGYPPETNTAARWTESNNKVVFESLSLPVGNIAALYETEDEIKGIDYLSHADILYVIGNNGVYESDPFLPNKLIKIVDSNNVSAISLHNGELWYMTEPGAVINHVKGTIINGASGYSGFCFIDDQRIARITNNGSVAIFDINGNVVNVFRLPGITNCQGISSYFDKLVTFNKNNETFVEFTDNGTILQTIESPVSGIVAWNISGINLIIYATFVTAIYRIHSQKYYAKLDKSNYLGYEARWPAINRAVLPGENAKPAYPELLSNGEFADGTTFPAGFDIPGPESVPVSFSNDVAVPGTRALCFTFTSALWKSINKYGLPVVGGKQYCFGIYTKASASTSGLLGVKFKDKDGVGTEQFFTIQYNTSYELRQVVVSAPAHAVTVDFRHLAYGSDSVGLIYYLNGLSLLESEPSDITFEHIYNGPFSVYPDGGSMAAGWEMTGPGGSHALTSIEPPVMQSDGMALKITTMPLDSGWTSLQSNAFEITEGDTLEASFYYRRGTNKSTNIQVSLYYMLADGGYGEAVHKTVTIDNPTGGSITKVVFDPNPAGSHTAKLRIWPEYDETNWIEKVSVVPSNKTNLINNGDFSARLSGWDRNGYPASGPPGVTGLGTELSGSGKQGDPYCLKFYVDQIACQYAECRQNVILNQTDAKKISFSAIASGNNITATMQIELYVKFVDGSNVYLTDNQTKAWAKGTFDKTKIAFDYTPPKSVASFDIIIGMGWGGTGTAYLYEVSAVEESGVVTADDIELEIPCQSLNVDTVRQIKISAQLLHQGESVDQKNLTVTFESIPAIGNFEVLGTNAKGKAQAIFTLPERACDLEIRASYGALSDSGHITINPLIIESKLEPDISKIPKSLSKLYTEIIVPRAMKPFPDISGRIGRWEVFRPPTFNTLQALDYDINYSPMSSMPLASPEHVKVVYPHLLNFHYFDDLSDYPHQSNWQVIMDQRQEWFCMDAMGLTAPFGDGRYYYNWRNMEATQWYVDRLLREMGAWADGIYIDDFWGESYGTLVDFDWQAESSQLINFKSVHERLEYSAARLKYLREGLHRRGKYLTSNFGCTRSFNQDGSLVKETKILADEFDGYLLECWLYTWTCNPADITESRFDLSYVKNEIDFVKWCGQNNKFVACLARSSSELFEARIFSLAGFLMGKHDLAFYCHSDWGEEPYGGYWHERMQPECFITTGEPLGDYQLDNGLFSREFENCVALLNMSGSQRTYVLPAGTWYTTRGVSYSGNITVNNRQGLVLVKNRI